MEENHTQQIHNTQQYIFYHRAILNGVIHRCSQQQTVSFVCLFVCLFGLFWHVNGAADGYSALTGGEQRLLGLLCWISRQVTARLLTCLCYSFSLPWFLLSLSFILPTQFLLSSRHLFLSLMLCFGQILLDSFPFSCLELCWNIFPIIDHWLQGKL